MRLYDSRTSDDGGAGGPDEADGPVAGLSKRAFDALYHLEHRRLWLLAAGLTGRATDADDVLQEALMNAYAKREFFRSTGNPEADAPDVPDPYLGQEDGFERVHDMVERACVALLEHIRATRL